MFQQNNFVVLMCTKQTTIPNGICFVFCCTLEMVPSCEGLVGESCSRERPVCRPTVLERPMDQPAMGLGVELQRWEGLGASLRRRTGGTKMLRRQLQASARESSAMEGAEEAVVLEEGEVSWLCGNWQNLA